MPDKTDTSMFDAFKIDGDAIAERYTTVTTAVIDAVVDAQHKMVDAWIAGADKLVEVLPMDLPAGIPAPAESGAKYLDFVEKAATLNREWNARVADMLRTGDVDHVTAPIVDAVTNMTESITESINDAVTPAKPAAAKKAPARKPASK